MHVILLQDDKEVLNINVPDIQHALLIMKLFNTGISSTRLHVEEDLNFTYTELENMLEATEFPTFELPVVGSCVYKFIKGVCTPLRVEEVVSKVVGSESNMFSVEVIAEGISYEFCSVGRKEGVLQLRFSSPRVLFTSIEQAVRYESLCSALSSI